MLPGLSRHAQLGQEMRGVWVRVCVFVGGDGAAASRAEWEWVFRPQLLSTPGKTTWGWGPGGDQKMWSSAADPLE